MRGPTLALIIGIAVVVIATVIALQQLSTPPTSPPAAPTQTTTPPTGATPTIEIRYDSQLAEKGRQYFSEIGCTACHSIRSLGISGGAVGPDLSRSLLGNPGAGGSVIGRFFREKGLENPAADPEKAAELLKEYMIDPPQYSTTMRTQTRAYKATYSDWATDQVPALVELLKEAAAKASR
jgi:cytochrome c2